jgi:hypothetical protein
MAYQIKWTKQQQARAKELGFGLFAFGADTPRSRFEVTSPLDLKIIERLSHFCVQITQGGKPAAAFKEAFLDTEAATEKGGAI